MKLMPASRAFATIRAEVASSVGPPNIMVPRQIGETFRPLRPSWRYCMSGGPSLEGVSIAASSRHCERSEAIHSSACGAMDCFVAALLAMTRLGLALQNLEHAARHRDDALVDGDLRGDEDQAPRRAHHMRARDQDLADLAGLDEMRVELHAGHPGLPRHVPRGHPPTALGQR